MSNDVEIQSQMKSVIAQEYKALLDAISPLDDLLGEYQPNLKKEESYF